MNEIKCLGGFVIVNGIKKIEAIRSFAIDEIKEFEMHYSIFLNFIEDLAILKR